MLLLFIYTSRLNSSLEVYKAHHKIQIDDSALTAAAQLSQRYISDRFLPDKAIDLIDEAASKLHIEKDKALERRLQPLFIDEPSVEATIEMLRALRPRYEAH